MTVLDTRPAAVAGTVTVSARSIERMASAIVHEELNVEFSAIRVHLSDDHGGLALAVTTPVVVDPDAPASSETVLERLHRGRARIASRMEALTGRSVSRVDVRVTGTRTRPTRRVV
ncbi:MULTISPECIES: hypothetical protein [unclassified Rathayibacter]|uniref:hypothetical protein n=1 Tax=unclassified Rathayibacter TaxID=2609250 RepID=UPI00188C0AD4|nr:MULTISPECIES: hypothetical protein [unclassified Rathayibacter]MBF4461529.1 hypothetical protein [Rathayibacter sp. VKM Ac-2879]MBF4502940.1 hypothetical protein [Rathayibacter sp. VKM Ac-2878]